MTGVVDAFAGARLHIDSYKNHGVTSDAALAVLRPALLALGFEIEASKTASGKIRRPVLYGENGTTRVAYEVDGFHPDLNIILEVEAGRGAAGNADYRDLIRTSLIVDADFLILAMMLEYRSGKTAIRSYERTRDQIDAIYASERVSSCRSQASCSLATNSLRAPNALVRESPSAGSTVPPLPWRSAHQLRGRRASECDRSGDPPCAFASPDVRPEQTRVPAGPRVLCLLC